MESPKRPTRVQVLTTCVLLYAAVACVASATYTGPTHKWWEERGPVVRHDSFPADCTLCHESGSWNKIRADFEFDHLAETGVSLEGAHQQAECLRCHNDRGPVQLFSARGCRGCHDDVHRGQLGPDCSSCHGQEVWRVFEFITEHASTRLPLIGAHAATACWSCHPGAQVGEFTRLDPECINCHQDDLLSATDPDHLASGWTSSCDRCHSATAWSSAGFMHTTFPLTGAHGATDCSGCHTGNVFAGTPTDCFSCHMQDYQATSMPDHAMSGFSTNCQDCHSTLAWTPAAFNHSWPLTGGHAGLDCLQCHGGGVYAGTPTDCFACHQSDYTATSMPNHSLSGFPTSCDDCHSTNAWTPATFNHSFPLVGPHNLNCVECHTTNNPPLFSCIDCHEHTLAKTTDEHDDVPGFVYASASCLACHPSGTR